MAIILKRNFLFLIVIVVLFIVATILFFKVDRPMVYAPTSNFKDATYDIEGQKITLKNGFAQTKVSPESISKITTEYFGNEAVGDLNADGISDVAFLVTQDGGGSGTFFYVVVALGSKKGYTGTNAVFIGDRIAPQTTEIRDGQIIVNYAERGADEPMSVRPSFGVSKYLKIINTKLIEVKAI